MSEAGPVDLVTIFMQNRARLRAIVQLRLDRRLNGRVDPSDVLQETLLEVTKRRDDYLQSQSLSPFLWLRFLTTQQVINVHRRQLVAECRDARREVSLDYEFAPSATTMILAAHLLGKLTSPVSAALKAERQLIIQQALEELSELDREMIALRHFEELTNQEVADLQNVSKDVASKRYIRAIKRLKAILDKRPAFFEDRN